MGGAAERHYDFWAPWYDRFWRRYSRRTTAALLDWVRVEPGFTVLDVGCGTGVLAEQLLARQSDIRIVGVDVSERMLERARARLAGSRAELVQARAADLPFADSTFDVVVSASAFHFFPDASASCNEMRRVLKDDGRLLMTDWSREPALMRIRDAVLRRLDSAHVRVYSSGEARAMLENAGFRVVREGGYRAGLYWMWLIEAAAASDEVAASMKTSTDQPKEKTQRSKS